MEVGDLWASEMERPMDTLPHSAFKKNTMFDIIYSFYNLWMNYDCSDRILPTAEPQIELQTFVNDVSNYLTICGQI